MANNNYKLEYQKLADINSRTACPRCEGFGFIHASIEKHDRASSLRCKKCISCSVCDSSGITVGVVKCLRCSGKGFYHNENAPKPHKYGEFVKCFDCLDCRDCVGLGVLDQKRIDFLREFNSQKKSKTHLSVRQSLLPGLLAYPPLVPDTAPFSKTYPSPYIQDINPDILHPHMLGILGLPINDQILDIMRGVSERIAAEVAGSRPDNQGKPTKKSKTTLITTTKVITDCPRCLGAGFRHDSSAKHDKKQKEKCRHCVSCKACSGTGKTAGKQACMNCETKGFVHTSTEREHDVGKSLRCFFCKDCPVCRGLGVESIKKAVLKVNARDSSLLVNG